MRSISEIFGHCMPVFQILKFEITKNTYANNKESNFELHVCFIQILKAC